MKNETAKAIFCAALGNIFWGLSFLFIKVALDFVSSPNIMLAHRFTISALLMLGMIVFGKQKISFKGKNWKPLVLLSAMQLCYYLFESFGILYTSSTISGLVLALVPVVAIGTGALFLKEYPTRRQALFCMLPVLGVIVISFSAGDLGMSKPLLGGFFLLMAMLSSAIFKTANRKASQEFSSFERTFIVLSSSAIAFTCIGLKATDWNVAQFAAPLLEIKYTASVVSLSLLCSIAANMLVNYATSKMSVFKVSSFGSLSTLCAAVVGIVFLKEPLTASLVIGGVLILVGVREVTKQK